MNYASWRAQFTNLLFGYDLLGFLDGTTPYPPETILVPQRRFPTPSASYINKQNCLVLHVILALVTLVVASLIYSATTSHEV